MYIPENSHAFRMAEASLGNSHHYFAGLVLPLVALAGIVENALIIFALPRLSNVLGSSTRFYCMSIAASQIGSLLCTHLANNFLEHGIEFLLGGLFSFATLGNWECKGLRAMNSFFPHLLNWTYFLLNLERLVSVLSPIRGRALFSLRLAQLYWALVLLAGVGVSIFAAVGYHVVYSPTHNKTRCTIYDEIGMAFRHTLTADVYVGPNLLSLILSLFLLFCVCRLAYRRERLFKSTRTNNATRCAHNSQNAPLESGAHSRNGNSNIRMSIHRTLYRTLTTRRSTSASQISSALTAVCLALVNVVFNLPGGILGTFYYIQTRNLDPTSAGRFWVAYLLVRSFGSFGSLCDLVIYMWRIPAFRKEICLCRVKIQLNHIISSIDDRTLGSSNIGADAIATCATASNTVQIPLT